MRRRWLRRLVGSLLALLSLAALRIVLGKTLGGWVAARERARFEREVGPLEPARLATPELSDDENAVPGIVAAVERLLLDEAEYDLLRRIASADAAAEVELAVLDALLAERDTALSALAAAAALPASSFGPRENLFHGGAIDSIGWLRAARVAAADGRRARRVADGARADRARRSLHGMALALRREPVVVFALLGATTEGLYLELLREDVAGDHHNVDWDAIEVELAALAALPDAFAIAHGEGVFSYDMLRRQAYAPRPAGSLRETVEAILWPWSEGHVEAGAIEGWREVATLARVPQARWAPIADLAGARRSPLRRWLDPTVPFETLRTMLLPNLLSAIRKIQFLGAAEQLALVAVALAREAEIEGRPPELHPAISEARTPDPATGSLPEIRRSPAGGLVVELPAARRQAAQLYLHEGSAASPGARRVVELLSWPIAPQRGPQAPAAVSATAGGDGAR